MKTLEEIGITPGNDEKHSILANIENMPAEHFFERAEDVLNTATPIVLKEIIPKLETYSGRWNPGGFMVFPLGLHDTLGSLRLHIWPAGFPRVSQQGPNIHNHAWHLASRILVGLYTDTLYMLEPQPSFDPTDSNLALQGLSRLFTTRRSDNGQDNLIQDGALVRPIPFLDRSITAGKTHTIEAGVYHITTIPSTALAATLVLDSPAFAITTHVLIDDMRPEILRSRQAVGDDDKNTAKTQLMGA